MTSIAIVPTVITNARVDYKGRLILTIRLGDGGVDREYLTTISEVKGLSINPTSPVYDFGTKTFKRGPKEHAAIDLQLSVVKFVRSRKPPRKRR